MQEQPPIETPTAPEPAPQPPKKPFDNKTAIIVAIMVIAATALSVAFYFMNQKNSTHVASQVKNDNQAIQTKVDDAVNNLTANIDKETKLTNTDDSANAANASDSASKVGGSVNENNF